MPRAKKTTKAVETKPSTTPVAKEKIIQPEINIGMRGHPGKHPVLPVRADPPERPVGMLVNMPEAVVIIRRGIEKFDTLLSHGSYQSP